MIPRPYHEILFDYGIATMQRELAAYRLRELRPAPVLLPINRLTTGESDAASNPKTA